MVVRENGLLLHGVLYAVLGLVRGLFRLEVYQTAGVLPVFQQVDNGVCRPLALIAGVIAAGAARPAVFQRTRRGDLLLRKHTGNLGRAVPGKAKLVYLPDYRRGFLVNDIILVLVHEIAVHRLAGNGFAAHAFCSFYCLDFFARISHQPFVEQISQRGKIVVHAAVCAVHIVVDSDKTHALLGEQHFRVKPYLQVVSP